jgi:tRNA-2-methylthio-N6-dimethylallyladenosine synthase
MEAIRDLPTLCEFVHFPIQAGSSRILKKMHRIYTKEQYLEKVSLLREIVPNVCLGTDIIVGFPTETEEEFQETYDVLKTIRYSLAFIFSYSPRKGTPAIRWKDDIPEEIKLNRLQRLMELQNEISNEERQAMLGSNCEVLIEQFNREKKQLKARTKCWKKVILDGDENLVGTLQQVKIHSYSHQTLLAQIESKNPLKLS